MSPNSDMVAEPLVEHSSTVSQVCFPGGAENEMVCLSLLRSRSSDINQSPWSKVHRPCRASLVKRSSQVQFLRRSRLTTCSLGCNIRSLVIQKVTAGAPQVRAHGQGGRESVCRDQFTPESTIQMIQKTDEFTDAARCRRMLRRFQLW